MSDILVTVAMMFVLTGLLISWKWRVWSRVLVAIGFIVIAMDQYSSKRMGPAIAALAIAVLAVIRIMDKHRRD